MKSHTLRDRAELYNQSRFGQAYPESRLRASDRWLQGQWVMGNNYRSKSGMYGSYPPEYMDRVEAIFPDVRATLHLFSGSLAGTLTVGSGRRVTLDLRRTAEVHPDVQGSAEAIPFVPASFDICYADPPYTAADAEKYGTVMIDRRKVLYEVHRVVVPGGFLVWLDTTLPMYRRDYWKWVGAIAMWRSTNHRVRGVHIFERVPHAGEVIGYDEDTRPLFDAEGP